MLYLVVGEVEVAQGLGHVGEGAVGHHLKLVVAQVESLQLRVAKGITGKRSQPGTQKSCKYNLISMFFGNEYDLRSLVRSQFYWPSLLTLQT